MFNLVPPLLEPRPSSACYTFGFSICKVRLTQPCCSQSGSSGPEALLYVLEETMLLHIIHPCPKCLLELSLPWVHDWLASILLITCQHQVPAGFTSVLLQLCDYSIVFVSFIIMSGNGIECK